MCVVVCLHMMVTHAFKTDLSHLAIKPRGNWVIVPDQTRLIFKVLGHLSTQQFFSL